MARENTARFHELSEWTRAFPENRIADFQLEKLNKCWASASSFVPFYKKLKKNHKLPPKFQSLQEYCELVPIIEKHQFQGNINAMHRADHRIDGYRITGGSTAAPIQLPMWKKEFNSTRLDPWLGRSWYGIDLKDRAFLFWGHSHLLGSGYRRYFNMAIRSLKDYFQNYVRHSCYDFSVEGLHAAGNAITKSNPRFLLGYGASLDALAKANWPLKSEFHRIGLKAVIGAAEAFPFEESVTTIQELFGCPVGMEYGAVETNLIGHTHPGGGYRVFWWNHLIEFDGNDPIEIRVTELYDRCTPLFRYRIGDQILGGQILKVVGQKSVIEFERVFGRCNLQIQLPSGRTLHSEGITHIVRQLPKVLSYQMVCKPNRLELQVVTKQSLTATEISMIKGNATKIDPEFGDFVQVVEVKKIKRTKAGKTPVVVIETS